MLFVAYRLRRVHTQDRSLCAEVCDYWLWGGLGCGFGDSDTRNSEESRKDGSERDHVDDVKRNLTS
jgi:hypothetical protein